jgi:protein-S-isoprenylcysteine O-methyltransferase Ste14
MAQPVSAGPTRDPGPERPKPLLNHPFRRKKLQPRPLVIHASAITALLAAQPTGASLASGLPLVAAGQALRLWAAGHLRKTDELTVTGPYAHLRHPLYAGAFALGCGYAIAAGLQVAAVALPLGFAFFFLYYLPRKERIETDRLAAAHGPAYRAYRMHVRALVPRWAPWPPAVRVERASARWSTARVRGNDEQSTLAWVLVASLALVAKWLL